MAKVEVRRAIIHLKNGKAGEIKGSEMKDGGETAVEWIRKVYREVWKSG